MKRVTQIQIVDDIKYVLDNCYQHQLLIALQAECEANDIELHTKTYNDVLSGECDELLEQSDSIISTLKLRTADKIRVQLGSKLKNHDVIFYDQDPWESFRTDGAHNGSYERINQELNIKLHVVTVQKYATLMNSLGYETKFEHIWMLPNLCTYEPYYNERSTDVSFMGTMYPWRKKMIDSVTNAGIQVNIKANSMSYHQYLKSLQDVRIFLCSHDSKLLINGNVEPERHGMYHKDVEVCSQGCISLSDASSEFSSYIDPKMRAVFQYDYVDQIPDIINQIQKMSMIERQRMIFDTVTRIKELEHWKSTARTLLNL